jgi:L-lactate dehydrogenase complex protein LldG
MKQTTARERVLKDIRNALMDKVENPYFYVTPDKDPYAPVDPVREVAFAEALTAVGGDFLYCMDERDMLVQLIGLMQEYNWHDIRVMNPSLKELLEMGKVRVAGINEPETTSPVVGLTACEALIARTGSVLVSSVVSDARKMYSFPEIHLVLAYASQVVPDIQDALELISERHGENIPSMITLVTGPSRTADIEKTLVMGAHGPKKLIVFLIDDINHPLS